MCVKSAYCFASCLECLRFLPSEHKIGVLAFSPGPTRYLSPSSTNSDCPTDRGEDNNSLKHKSYSKSKRNVGVGPDDMHVRAHNIGNHGSRERQHHRLQTRVCACVKYSAAQ